MDSFFFAKIDDLLAQSEKGHIACSRFFDPAEQYNAEAYLKRLGIAPERYAFYGGYAEAERRVLLCLPEWCMEESDAYADALCAIRIAGSTFRSLSHPQYLGSLLALGIDRQAVGDIVLQDDCHAVCFVIPSMAQFLLQEHAQMRVASDTVKLQPYCVEEGFCANREVETITDTIPSARLDCVVASLLRTSRSRAQEALLQRRVKLNFTEVTEADAEVCQGDSISIRGAGRFRIVSCQEKTKKERLRLVAEHFVT